MTRFAILSAALLLPIAAHAAPDATPVAQEILDKGAALFDARDAAALAATYTEDAEISLTGKDPESGAYKSQVVRGRQAIEKGYKDLFKDTQSEAKSKNRVEFAHFVNADLLVIHGHFQPDISKEGDIPFIQVRLKKGDQWLMTNLQLFVVSKP